MKTEGKKNTEWYRDTVIVTSNMYAIVLKNLLRIIT